MIKKSFLSTALCILCTGNACAFDAAKQSTQAKPKHVYNLPRLAQQLKRLPKDLTRYILHLSEVTPKKCEVFSFNDAWYKKFMTHESGDAEKLAVKEKALLSVKDKQVTKARLLDIASSFEPHYVQLYAQFVTLPEAMVTSMRDRLGPLIEPEMLHVSSLNQKIMRSLISPIQSTAIAADTQVAGLEQPALPVVVHQKRKLEDKDQPVRRSARIAAQHKNKK